MRQRDAAPLWAFALESLFAAAMCTYGYYVYCFANATNPLTGAYINGRASLRLFLGLAALSFLAGLALTPPRARSSGTAYLNALLPLELYALLCLLPHRPVLTGVAFCGAALLCVLAAAYMLTRPKARRSPRVLLRRLAAAARRCQGIGTVCLFIPFFLYAVGLIHVPAYAETAQARYEQVAEAGQSALESLEAGRWQALSPGGRLAALQAVVAMEAQLLGVPRAPAMLLAALPGNVTGQYSHQRNVILIDEAWLDSRPPARCLNTALHELYHCYQHALCQALDTVDGQYRGLAGFAEIEALAQGFGDYQQEGEAYYDQLVEVQARDFAARRAEYYMALLDGQD